ncbi:MAG: hypothetical protein AUH78_13790 [Gemmatimonadetes bacterium 13_1_40CM_4_69_8]|nr:MAG: hypothetical protein AUH46_04615 [Gemmatimonadetes bacterium 13_1_40CM_70_15]OLC73415.1 MAG: hypothetical protein AUH78_13790 [Gemmatimonadetes bacterium 13_1_40CM_4_69_8]OLE66229.1 MAG: hypothetical protein AUG03_00960 [Acidobacteria bacterium 13_1_20CM_2_68_14]
MAAGRLTTLWPNRKLAPMRLSLWDIPILALVASLSGTLHAQRQSADTLSGAPARVFVDRPPYEVIYDHLSGTLELRSHKGQVLEHWERGVGASAAPLIRLPVDRPVVVVIRHANALLYDYAVSSAVVTRKDVRACRDAGKRFSATALLAELSVLAVEAPPRGLTRQVLGKMVPDVETRSFSAAPRGGRLDAAALEQTLREIREPIRRYLDFTGTVVLLANTLQDSLVRIAELGESTPIDSLLAQLQQSIESAQAGLSAAAQVPQLLSQRAEAARPHLRTLAAVTRAIRAGDFAGDRSAASASEALALAGRVDSVLPALEAAYRRLEVALVRIETARARSTQTFTTGPSGDVRRLVVELRPTGDMQEVPRVRQGRLEIYAEPTVSTQCEISIGVAWMEPPAEYDVVDSVVVNRGGKTRSAASLAFHVSSPSFPLLGALLGIGMGPNKRPDFYLGASLRLLEPVLVNSGVVWQYGPRLPAGIQVGQKVSDFGFLDHLPSSYQARVFWGLSYAP